MIATPLIENTYFKTASGVESPPCAPFKATPPNLDTHMVGPHQDNVSKKLTYEDRDSGTIMYLIDDVVMKN